MGIGGYHEWVQDNWTSRGERLDFDEHKYLVQIYRDQHPHIEFMKSAQTGATERMLTEAVYLPDQFNVNSIYFFPTSGTISDLVQERIDDPINNSSHLRGVLRNSKGILGKTADKVGLKRLSKGFVYFRGANQTTQITSVAGDIMFIDELDRMPQENVPYFTKRLEHSSWKWERWASTPTIPNFGIHKSFILTDQHHYHVKCTHCNEWQELDFFENVEYTMKTELQCENAQLVCKKCRREIVPWLCESEWVPKSPHHDKRGYFVSKLYSPRTDFKKVVEASKKASESEIQQFYNQDLGLPYEPKGGRITEEILQSCRRSYELKPTGKPTFMGIDVGRVLHVVIQDIERVLYIGTVKDFEQLDELMNTFDIKKAVVDAMPETRKSQEFADKYPGRVLICYYSGVTQPKEGEWFKVDGQKVNTDRTLSLDMWTARFKNQSVYLPQNLDFYTEFKEQMKSLIRVVSEDRNGNPKAEYIQTSADHYYHSGNYSNIAKSIFESTSEPEIFVL